MPRLDNSDYAVIEWFELDFDEDDPGATEPVDVCIDCWINELNHLPNIEHPSYGDDPFM